MIRKISLAASLLIAGSVLAQAPIGSVVSVQGVATATTGTAGVVVVPGMPVVPGTRIVTNAGSTVVVRLNNGCIVNLGPARGITIRDNVSCEQLVAGIVPVGQEAAVITRVRPGPVPFGAALIGLGALGTIGAIAAIDDDDRDAQPISPN